LVYRLAAWYHWKDRQSLIHALWVAERQPVKIQKIKKWSENEGESEKFAEFLAEYKKLGTK
jgi:chromosome segregation and condensation protein ScpB